MPAVIFVFEQFGVKAYLRDSLDIHAACHTKKKKKTGQSAERKVFSPATPSAF